MNAIEHLKKLREESYPTVNFASEETTPFDVVASGLDNALLLHNAGSEAHAICALETIQSKDAAIEKFLSHLRSSVAENWVTQNADGPIEDVLLALKRNIWSIL